MRIIRCISNKINTLQLEDMLFNEEDKENEIIINLAKCYVLDKRNRQDLKTILGRIDYQIIPKPFSHYLNH